MLDPLLSDGPHGFLENTSNCWIKAIQNLNATHILGSLPDFEVI